MSNADSFRPTRAVVALIGLLLVAVAGFFFIGRFASRVTGFDWELASIFGTAVGTVLLATATGLLALVTRAEVFASRQELALSRTAFQASTRPILVDAPLDVFTIEKEVPTFGLRPLEQGIPRRIHDLGRISVSAGQASGQHQAEGYARITVPLHNVGAGLALIRDARLIGFDVGWSIPWRRSSMQTAAPPGQLTQITFSADIDPGDGQALEVDLGDLDDPVSFSVEVDYSDLSGEQRTRTLVTVEGARSYWRVTDVKLYHGDSDEPFVVLHREAEVAAPRQ